MKVFVVLAIVDEFYDLDGKKRQIFGKDVGFMPVFSIRQDAENYVRRELKDATEIAELNIGDSNSGSQEKPNAVESKD